jgi:hypothetical protein
VELTSNLSSGLKIDNELDKFIDKHGYYIILARPIKQMLCRCWNPLTKEPSPKCPICLGTGHPIKYERHKVRSSDAAMSTTAIQVMPTGPSISPKHFFYMKKGVVPDAGMFIIACEWKDISPLRSGMEVFEINYVDKLRGKNGQITYYTVAVDSRPEFVPRFSEADFSGLKVVDR